MHFIDRLTYPIAPRWTFKRQQARAAAEIMARHFEAAAAGRRTQGWSRHAGDVNAASAAAITRVRDVARDMVRNNPYATSALETIVDHAVGWGIVGSPLKTARNRARADAIWKAWAETTACDAENRQDLYGLQKQVMRTVVQDGECLIRRRWRRPEDNLPIPMQLQLLEPEFLDTTIDRVTPAGHRIIQGVEFDLIGRRVAYYLFREHPGAQIVGSSRLGPSDRIPATEILHVFKPGRPGQVRAVSWFANVVLRMKDFDEYEDAALMKQKIAACLAVITSDIDGSAPSLGTVETEEPAIDRLEPGMILNVPPGRSVATVDPPTISEHAEYAATQLRAIATGLGVTYEDLTGDYAGMPYSAARMSRIRHWSRVEGWRWQLLIPQFCDPVWSWAMEAAEVMGLEPTRAEWTAPPAPMIDPSAEGLAYQRNIRSGIITQSESLRERGYDPDTFFAEMAEDNKKIDKLGLILDSDARRNTQAGLPRELPIAEIAEKVDALGALIRAGYDPEESLTVVGLPKIKHLGVPPITVQAENGKKPAFGQPAVPAPNGNGNGKETAAAKELARVGESVEKALEFIKGTAVHQSGNGHAKKPGKKKTTVARDDSGKITETIEEVIPEVDGA